MRRLNISVPDDLADRARAAGLNVSRVASQALSAELDRRAKLAALDSYLDELATEQGPIPEVERRAACEWVGTLSAPARHADAS